MDELITFLCTCDASILVYEISNIRHTTTSSGNLYAMLLLALIWKSCTLTELCDM
jgi:hypothetical protein